MSRKKVMTPAEALGQIAAMDGENAKQILFWLAGQFCGNPDVWPQFTAALGKPKPGERIVSA